MSLYDLKKEIERKEKELSEMRKRLQDECTHPKETLNSWDRDNNPDPLQEEIRFTWNECQLCGKKWKSNERKVNKII